MRGRRPAAWLSAPLGYLRRRDRMVAQVPPGPVALGPDVALLCHYDADGDLRADLLGYVAALRQAGFAVVLVSNSGRLRAEALAAARAVCAAVLLRHNSGRDFSAWREALLRLGLPRPDTRRLLLTNDSLVGPLAPLAPLLARMDASADVWGLTESRELGWHLQSYFLLAQGAVLHSAAWQRFWRGVRPHPVKLLTVLRYEVGLSRSMRRAGFRLRALFATPDDGANPTLAHWQALRIAGFPFIKRSLAVDDAGADPP
jgi:lipopolysaccharide biosynthesis protein